MTEWNADAVRHALTVAREHGFAEVEVEASGASFLAKLALESRSGGKTPATAAEGEAQDAPLSDITAPLVGYYQPSEPPLREGRQVQKGDIVAIITALGLANDVEAATNGEIVSVLVEAGQTVQYGQVLAQVRVSP